MDSLTAKEQIDEYKKHSKYCIFCGEPTFVDGVSIRVISITESGGIVAHENEEMALTSVLPACAYHMVLGSEGLLFTTQDGVLGQSNLLSWMEKLTDAELRKELVSLRRGQQDILAKAKSQTIKTLQSARKFKIAMDEGISKQSQ